MPKAKPVSLHPLTFDEAIKAIINVDPEKVGLTSKSRKRPLRKRESQDPENSNRQRAEKD